MRIEKVKIFSFDELSEEVQEKVLNDNHGVNVEHFDWWFFVYDDAEVVNLKITAFDVGRGNFIEMEFNFEPFSTAKEIIKNHRKETETYRLSQNYLVAYDTLEKDLERYSDLWENINPETEAEEILEEEYAAKKADIADEIEELENEFLKELSEEYLSLLKKEYEFLTSEEAVKETIISNDWEFTENGEMW